MKLGDVIRYANAYWAVVRVDVHAHLAILDRGLVSVNETIADDLDISHPGDCQVFANPPEDWPSTTLAQRRSLGTLVAVGRPLSNGAFELLERFSQWFMADPQQVGGSIFFNPSLKLRHGDVLVAKYAKGSLPIQIPKEFLSLREKNDRANASALPDRPNLFQRLRQREE